MAADPLSFRRRLALVEVPLTAGEAIAACGLVAALLPEGDARSGAAMAAVGLGGALALWSVAAHLWSRPIARAAVEVRAGRDLEPELGQRAYAALVALPARLAALRVVLFAALAAVAASLSVSRGRLPARAILGVSSTVALAVLLLQVPRLRWAARVLDDLRRSLGVEPSPLRRFRDGYLGRLVEAALGTGGPALAATLAFSLFLPVTRDEHLRLATWLPLSLGALFVAWLGLLGRLARPIEAYLEAAAGEAARVPSGEDPRAVAAFRSAQALPYLLGISKVGFWILGGLLVLVAGPVFAGMPRESARLLAPAAGLFALAAGLFEVQWHRATLRPLLAHLAGRHRLSPDLLRTRLSLRRKLLFTSGGITLFACGVALLVSLVQYRGLLAAPAPGSLPPTVVSPLALLLSTFVLLLASSMVVVVLGVLDLTAPLRALERQAEAMARGDLARPVAPLGGEADEVGRLTHAFEEMRRALSDKLRSSTEVNLFLEQEVRRRTAELERRMGELARALDELRRTQAELVRSEKLASMGRLVAGIAHEINNPVNALVNTAGPLEGALDELLVRLGDRCPDEARGFADEARDMLQVIQRGARRTRDIVQALHNYSRGDDSKPVEVDLHRTIDDSLDLLRHHLRQGIVVERDYGEQGQVRGFPGQLHQVLMNLLTNAAQAISSCRTEGGRIRVATRRDGAEVEVAITDDGPGIPAETLPRIFDPFFTTKEVGEGSGLGLSIVQGIVERHGGRIAVDSRPGQGTTFTLRLPIAGPGG